jgi:WNK lysine deficient protein kinase
MNILGYIDLTIKGRRREDDGIFLRLRIADEKKVKVLV